VRLVATPSAAPDAARALPNIIGPPPHEARGVPIAYSVIQSGRPDHAKTGDVTPTVNAISSISMPA